MSPVASTRPVRSRKEDRQKALVQAAFNQIAERGFEGLRTREVAAGVGLNIATLHYYFPTKESLIRGVVAYDVAARIRYAGADLAEAVRGTFAQELTKRGSTGGLVAVGGDGRIVVAHNSPMMFSARGTGPEPALTT